MTHHPFDLPDDYDAKHLVGRAKMAMAELASVGADLFLAGHLHVSHIGRTAERYQIEGHSALVVQAGTMSTRQRGEANSFNVLRLNSLRITVERRTWDAVGERLSKCRQEIPALRSWLDRRSIEGVGRGPRAIIESLSRMARRRTGRCALDGGAHAWTHEVPQPRAVLMLSAHWEERPSLSAQR